MMKRAKKAMGGAANRAAGGSSALFEQYCDPATDEIGPEGRKFLRTLHLMPINLCVLAVLLSLMLAVHAGVERFCSDINTDPSDRKVLLLAWKMRAKRMGFFSREEFQSGLTALKATTTAQIQRALPGLEEQVECNPDSFRDFCTFAFKYCLTEPSQKLIDIDTAVTMLAIVMPREPLMPRFCDFLKEQTEYKVINFDQWTSFLRFAQEVKPDLSNYRDEDAWPILLDNFVEWGRRNADRPIDFT
mmetsp:Transcript_1084/g.3303  ORF Transcript_1084/g.3303 Transcript_1084/m.3303 type:complete len:245 (+) Transcript_1084:313-1047(+)